MIEDTQATPAADTAAENSDLVLMLAPCLPLASGTAVPKVIGLTAMALIALSLGSRWLRSPPASDCQRAGAWLLLLMPLGVVIAPSLEPQAIVQMVQLSLIALTLRVSPTLRCSADTSLTLALSLFLSALSLFDLVTESGLLFENPNAQGMAALCYLAVIVKLLVPAGGEVDVLKVLLCSALPLLSIAASESRASLLAAGLVLGWPVLQGMSPSTRLRRALPSLFLLLPIFLLGLVASGALDELYDYLPVVGDKTPFSGRDVIWLSIFGELEVNGYRGFGLGSLPGGLLEGNYEGLSAHNGFVQILYQLGALGLCVFLVACATLVRALSKRDDRGVSAAILLGAMAHEMFEVAMTQNHFGAGLLLWLMASAPGMAAATAPSSDEEAVPA